MHLSPRITRCGSLALALFGMTLAHHATAAQLANPHFANGLSSWQWQSSQSGSSAVVLTQAGLDGSDVLEITRSADSGAPADVLEQTVQLETGKNYRFGVWSYAEGAGQSDLFAGSMTTQLPLGTYDWTYTYIDFTAESASLPFGVRILGASEKLWVAKFSLSERTDVSDQIDAYLQQRQNELQALKTRLAARPELRQDSYINMGMAIAERYIERARNDGPGGTQGMREIQPGDPEVKRWSLLQARELAVVLQQTAERLDVLEADAAQLWQMPDLANKEFQVEKEGFYYEDENGVAQPVVLGGYGHFDAVINDEPFLRTLGFNLVQQERGPRELRGNGKVSTYANRLLNELGETSERGYFIDFLLSPHYMENSLFDQYPDFRSAQNRGFIRYNIDHPAAREWVENWIQTVVPIAKDKPALFGFCLSNEPGYFDSGRDAYSRPIWHTWLQERHNNDLAALNAAYGTSYTSFEEIDVPAFEFPSNRADWPAYFDWVQFNQQHFANWHLWMRDMIKEIAPDALVHAKIMPDNMDTRPQANRTHGGILGAGMDPELITTFSDLGGCDSWSFTSRSGEWAYTWQRTHLWYDLLHSFNQKPVFDSELHFIEDRTPADTIPWEQSYAIIWQGAQHNRTAFVNWIWQEPTSRTSLGSVYLRPGNTYAASKAMLDLNRLAGEITAFNAPQAEVALLYSPTSLFWQQDYPLAMKDVYTLLTFLGHKITFISERQLAEGNIPASVSHLFLPRATHAEATTAPAIEDLISRGVAVIPVGSDALAFDRYDRPQSQPQGMAPALTIGLNRRSDLHNIATLLEDVATLPPALYEQGTNRRAWGVEYRLAEHNGRQLLSLANMLGAPVSVAYGTEAATGVDLISGDAVNLSSITLAPTEVMLIDLGAVSE